MKLKWTKIPPLKWSVTDRLFLKSNEIILFRINLSNYGKTWGSSSIKYSLQFSIHERIAKTDGYDYQLLVKKGQDPYGHVYIHTVKEGKEIAEKILADFYKKRS